MSQPIPVRLYGELGRKFGRSHSYHLDTKTPAEALAALFSQVKGARQYFMDAKARGIEFAVFVGKRNLAKEHLGLPANEEIRIAPIPAGAKRAGVLTTIVGAVLVVVGYLATVTNFYGGSIWGPYVQQAGWAMVAGGVVQLLTPLPHGNSAKDSPDNQANYNFNGAINTSAQGNPVPLAYGRVKVGSAVISAGIDTKDTVYTISRQNPKLGFMGGGGIDFGGVGNVKTDPGA